MSDIRYDNTKHRQPHSSNYQRKTESVIDDNYLKKGYFDETGNLFEEYLKKDGIADQIAKNLGIEKPEMKNHQLRRFYGHVRAAENRLRMTNDFNSVYIDIKKLEPFVAEAKGKNKIPKTFYDFIIKNTNAVKNKKDFLEGFLEHFQAVVAFFTLHYPKK
jgi:CRISPR-associated protein Csm2